MMGDSGDTHQIPHGLCARAVSSTTEETLGSCRGSLLDEASADLGQESPPLLHGLLQNDNTLASVGETVS